MLAILGPRSLYDNSPEIRDCTTLAGVNFDQHFVVSGSTANLARVEHFLRDRGITHQRLAVAFAFHSSGIDLIKNSFLAYCHALPSFKPPQIRFLSGMTTTYLPEVSASYFWDVVRQQIRFQETVARMEREQASIFVDCGPAGTSANFIKYNLGPHSQSRYFSILTAYNQSTQNLQMLREFLAGTSPTADQSGQQRHYSHSQS